MIIDQGYIARRSSRKGKKIINRNWFLVKDKAKLAIGNLRLPRTLEGERVRLRVSVEVLDDDDNGKDVVRINDE